MKFTRHATILRGQFDAAPFAGVFFLLVMFMMLASLVYTPGARLALQLPPAEGLPGTDKPCVSVAIDADGRLYYENQWIEESDLRRRLHEAVRKSREPLALVVQADKGVSYEKWLRVALLGREAGLSGETLLATLPGAGTNRVAAAAP
jgi:biopolymer transport protein ExbD